MSLNKLNRWFYVTVISIFLVACTEQKADPLVVGTNIWPGYEPLYVARSAELWDNESIKLVEFTSASEVLRAFRNNTLDVAALTLDEALLLIGDRTDARIIMGTDFSAGGDAVIAQSEITNVSDLVGKKIGVESTALGAYMLARFLEKSSLSAADITPVYLQFNEHLEAFKSKKVDAVVTFDPIRTELLKLNGSVLFSTISIPKEVIDVLVTSEDVIRDKPEQLHALVKGWNQSIKLINNSPEQSLSLMMPRLGMSKDELEGALAGIRLLDAEENRKLFVGEAAEIKKIAAKVQDVMLSNYLMPSAVFRSEHIDDQFVE